MFFVDDLFHNENYNRIEELKYSTVERDKKDISFAVIQYLDFKDANSLSDRFVYSQPHFIIDGDGKIHKGIPLEKGSSFLIRNITNLDLYNFFHKNDVDNTDGSKDFSKKSILIIVSENNIAINNAKCALLLGKLYEVADVPDLNKLKLVRYDNNFEGLKDENKSLAFGALKTIY